MEFEELVKERRSVRSYKEAEVSPDDLKEIVRCALMAPSWKNSETGRYHAALSKEAIEAVGDCLPEFNRNRTKNASYIVVSFKKDISGFNEGKPCDPNGNILGGYDLGLQNAYLLLKAKEMGYDTLVMGLRDDNRLREILDIPEDEIIMAVLAIGKRNVDPDLRPRLDVEEILKIS